MIIIIIYFFWCIVAFLRVSFTAIRERHKTKDGPWWNACVFFSRLFYERVCGATIQIHIFQHFFCYHFNHLSDVSYNSLGGPDYLPGKHGLMPVTCQEYSLKSFCHDEKNAPRGGKNSLFPRHSRVQAKSPPRVKSILEYI